MANGFQGPPAVDFYSMLSGLGDTIAKNRADSAKRDAYAAALTPDPATGKVDFNNAILRLAQVDPHAASVLQSVQAHQDSQASTAWTQSHTLGRDKIEDDWSDQTRQDTLNQNAISNKLQRDTADRLANPTPAGYQRVPGTAAVPAVPGSGSFPGVDAVPAGSPRLTFQPGGPEDPATIQSQAAAKAKADAANPSYSTTPIYGQDTDPSSPTYGKTVIMQAGKDGGLVRSKLPDGVGLPSGASDGSLASRASRYLDTGNETLINRRSFGAGQQGQQQFDALQNEIERQRVARGMRPDEVSANAVAYKAKMAGASAGARTRANREENLNMILEVADAAVPAALEASQKIPRGMMVPLNQLIQKGQVMTSNADLNDFGIANLQLAEGWARAMNPTGVMRDADRDKALERLNLGLETGTYERAVKQVQKQITRERDAIHVGGQDPTYDTRAINGGRAIKVDSPEDAAAYPKGTKILIPNGSGGFSPGVVP
jgi:hypothetical protein